MWDVWHEAVGLTAWLVSDRDVWMRRGPSGVWRITGSDRDVSLELDVGYRSVSVSPKGLYDRREFILDWGESSRGGEGGRGRPGIPL